MYGAASQEVPTVSITADSEGPVSAKLTAAQCGLMSSCTNHVASHCPTLNTAQDSLVVWQQLFSKKGRELSASTAAKIAFPTGLFRPPIV